MSASFKKFVQRLDRSRLISRDELHTLLARIPAAERPTRGDELARWLVKAGHLTVYQAKEIYHGRTRFVLGNYVILDQLGAGGMGQVFKAEHRRMSRIVALKLLPNEVAENASLTARFQREVRVTAKLMHPNIVTSFDADEADGTLFLVMEYVAGQDLASLVKQHGPLPVTQGVKCIRDAARGLQYAHQNGVIHRDIKPANLLLAEGDNGEVKVLDLGLARFEKSGLETPDDSDLTGTGAVMGTVDYMSPEQAVNTKHADQRSDVYSLGITLHYLLTGRPAYPGSTVVERLIGHREAPIPSLRSRNTSVPEGVDRVFARMVAKDPADRFQSMSDVIGALDAGVSADNTDVTDRTQVVADGAEAKSLNTFLNDLDDDTPPTPMHRAAPRVVRSKRSSPSRTRRPAVMAVAIGCVALLLATPFFVPGLWSNGSDGEGDSDEARGPTDAIDGDGSSANQTGGSSVARNITGLHFDGVDDYVLIPTLSLNDIPETEPLTLEITLSIESSQVCNPISWLGDRWIALFAMDGTFGAGRLTSSGSLLVNSPMPLNQPQHVAIVWDGQSWRLFLEGRQVSGEPVGYDLQPTSGGLYLGGVPLERLTGHRSGRWFRGVLSEVRVSRGARYRADYSVADRLTTDDQTLALYHFERTGDGRLRDESGRNHHGTIHGATWVE